MNAYLSKKTLEILKNPKAREALRNALRKSDVELNIEVDEKSYILTSNFRNKNKTNKMKYYIKFKYRTGSTLRSYEEEGLLEDSSYEMITWNDLSKAQDALKRMREHYLWRNSETSRFSDPVEKPEWYQPYFIDKRHKNPNYDYFNVINDNGEIIWIDGDTYLGHFESLLEASIEIVEGTDPNKFVI